MNNFQKLFFLSIIFFGFFGFVQVSHAADYYVSPTGSVSWPTCTTSGNPCAVATALTNAVAGDMVNFNPGSYDVGNSSQWYIPALNPAHSGTSGNPITFIAAPGTVTIAGTGGTNPLVGSYGHDYVIWDGFIVNMQGHDKGAIFSAANNCTLQNCVINGDYMATGDNHDGVRVDQATNIIIRNNKFQGIQGDSWNSCGIKTYVATNLLAEHNEIYNCTGGFSDKQQGQNNTWRYNLIHDLTSTPCHVHTQAGALNNIYIYQNVIYNVNTALDLDNDVAQTYDNLNFYNNTIHITSSGGWVFGYRFVNTNTSVYNNIVYNPDTSAAYWADNSKPSYENYNDYYPTTKFIANKYQENQVIYNSINNWNAATVLDANSINQDPLFANAAAHDFHLQAGSPALTSGRGGSWSVVQGAYITGNETIGLTSETTPDVTPPAAPSGLSVQ
jgi:hypothetical protein